MNRIMKMLIKYFYAIMNVLDLCLEGSITMEYSAAMTSRPYLYKETKIVASLLDNGADITDIKNISVKENIKVFIFNNGFSKYYFFFVYFIYKFKKKSIMLHNYINY